MAVNSSTGVDQTRSGSPFRTLFNRVRWIGLLVIGLAGTFFYSAEERHETSNAQAEQAPQAVTSKLDLKAERRGTDVLLSWNQAPAITGATEGALIIRAENSTQQIVLTPGQLRSGGLLYAPTGEEIELGLEVRGAGHAVAEGTVVIPPLPLHDAASDSLSAVSTGQSSESTIQGDDRDLSSATGGPTNKSESKLRLSGKGPVVVLAQDLSISAELHRNPNSLERLIRSGSLFTVAVGTAVAAQQMESRQVKVRVMEGINYRPRD